MNKYIMTMIQNNDILSILLNELFVHLPPSLYEFHHHHHHHHHYHQLITRHIRNIIQQDDLVLYSPISPA